MMYVRQSVLFLILFWSCTQTPNEKKITHTPHFTAITSADSLEFNAAHTHILYGNEKYTGLAYTLYPDGDTAQTTSYLKGLRHGALKKYFRNGLCSYSSSYYKGKRHGKATSWWKNGNKRSLSQFENGRSQGIQLEWYKNGAMFKKLNLVDGKEVGLQQSLRKNGKIYNNYEVINGRIFGLKRSKLCYELEEESIK